MFIYYMYVDILLPLTKSILIMFERVTTHYQTLQTWQAIMQRVTITSTRYQTRYNMCYRTFSLSLTWVGHNAACYHNFNLLPHEMPYIFTQLGMFWGYLQRVTTRYCQIYKKKCILIFFLKKLTVTRGNPLQITMFRFK